MDPSKAAVLAVATMLGLLVLARGEGARASAITLRPRAPVPVPVAESTVDAEHCPAAGPGTCATSSPKRNDPSSKGELPPPIEPASAKR